MARIAASVGLGCEDGVAPHFVPELDVSYGGVQAAVEHLCAELNDTETVYPGTNLRLVYELVSSRIPGKQEF
ncbi:MAG: hypothetical protein WC156_03485 [Pedobacter sp.]